MYLRYSDICYVALLLPSQAELESKTLSRQVGAVRGTELIEKWNTDMGTIMKYHILMVQIKFSEISGART